MKRIILAVVIAVLAPIGLVAVSATSALASGPSNFDCNNFSTITPKTISGTIGTYAIGQGAEGCLSSTHKCVQIGSADQFGNTAIECADVWVLTSSNSPETISAVPVIEAYCQNASDALVQCANVNGEFELANGAGTVFARAQNICGHSSGRCDVPGSSDGSYRNGFPGNGTTLTGCGGTNTAHEVWAVDLAGVAIELPRSDITRTSGSNFASNHAVICT
jgi:hypothetical protein